MTDTPELYWERRFQEQCADGDEQATQRLALHGRITELEAGRDVEQTMLRNAATTIQAAEAECDRLRAALAYAEEVGGQAIRAEAQAVRDLEEELVAVRSQIDAVRALAEDAMKLPTIDDPRAADNRVSPRAVLAALGEWPRSPVGRAPTCPGCGTQDSNGADGWVTHRGRPWHGACVSVQAAERAGLL